MLYPEGIPQTDIVPGLEETLGLDAAEEVVKADRLIENSPFDPGVGHVHGLPDFSEVTGRRRHCPGSKFWPRDRPWPGDRIRPWYRLHSEPKPCPGSSFRPRDRPWPGDGYRPRYSFCPGDRSCCRCRLWLWCSLCPRARPGPGNKPRPRDRFRPGDKSRCRGGICRKSLVGNRKSSPCKQRKNHRQDNNPRSLQWSKSNGMHFSARKIIDAYLSRNHVVFHKFSFVCVSITLIKFK